MDLLLNRAAVVSPCGKYRYRLEREIGSGKTACGIMVNPSTADGLSDDATIRKWLGFAVRNDIGRFIIGNKFAYRSTDVKALRSVDDPCGPENDEYLEAMMREADLHIVAWGPLAKLPPNLRSRWLEIVTIADRVGCELLCLGTAKDGHPRHPLMLAYSTPLVPWLPTATGKE